jgi:hypothetical protein
MAEVIAILSSSRAYEFPPDRIRLTVMALPSVGTAVQEAFQFQVAGMAVPPSTFGPVSPTFPPGAIFQLGVLAGEEGPQRHIREVHVEPRRVVISVAGPSSEIDRVWTRLRQVLDRFAAAEGAPILGDPERVREFSELTVRLDVPPQALVAPALVSAAEESAGKRDGQEEKRVLVPALHSILWPEDAEYPGDYPGGSIGPRNVWTLSLRAGSVVGAGREFYSAAPLASDRHLAYLAKVERALVRASLRRRGG